MGGAIEPPEKLDDLELALTLSVQYYQQAKLDGAPETILQNLIQYIEQVQDLMAPPVQQAPQMAPGAPIAPQEAPLDQGQGQPMPATPMAPGSGNIQ